MRKTIAVVALVVVLLAVIVASTFSLPPSLVPGAPVERTDPDLSSLATAPYPTEISVRLATLSLLFFRAPPVDPSPTVPVV